jgi:hypothetical protein
LYFEDELWGMGRFARYIHDFFDNFGQFIGPVDAG